MSTGATNLRQILGLPKGEFRKWREVALIAALLMEISWLAPWLSALLTLENPIGSGKIFAILSTLGITTFALMRILAMLSLRQNVRLLILGLTLALAAPYVSEALLFANQKIGYFESLGRIFAGFRSTESLLPNEFLLVFALVFVWLRAIRWATADGLPSEMRSAFRFGFLMLVIFTFVFIWRGGQHLAGYEFGFMFFALLAMGSSRIARSEAHPAMRGKFFDSRWLLALLGAILLFSLFLALVGWGINAQFALVRQAVFYLWLLFWGLVILILSPLLIVITIVFEWILSQVDPAFLASLRPITEIIDNGSEDVAEVVEQADGIGLPFLQQILDWLNSLSIAGLLEQIRPYFLWAVIAVFILIGIYFAGRKIAFWKALSDNLMIRNSVNYEDDWLKNWAKHWRRRLEDLRNTLARFADPGQGRKLLAAARIRRVYAYLMDLSAELGKKRRRAETPLEFMAVLNKLFPFHYLEVETISKAYMRVRYGELDETPKDVVEVDRAWLQLRLEGELLKRKLKRKKKAAAQEKIN